MTNSLTQISTNLLLAKVTAVDSYAKPFNLYTGSFWQSGCDEGVYVSEG